MATTLIIVNFSTRVSDAYSFDITSKNALTEEALVYIIPLMLPDANRGLNSSHSTVSFTGCDYTCASLLHEYQFFPKVVLRKVLTHRFLGMIACFPTAPTLVSISPIPTEE